jgi:hypothetical protein
LLHGTGDQCGRPRRNPLLAATVLCDRGNRGQQGDDDNEKTGDWLHEELPVPPKRVGAKADLRT